jgi:hypothetical protein
MKVVAWTQPLPFHARLLLSLPSGSRSASKAGHIAQKSKAGRKTGIYDVKATIVLDGSKWDRLLTKL